MKTKTLRQQVTFDASPNDVYEALMDAKKHAKFTGAPAKISRAIGGKFEAHGKYITGSNVELKPGKKIVQAWHGGGWPEGHMSLTTYNFSKAGKKTKMAFRHSGIPEKEYQSIKSGWNTHYWEPMKAMFAPSVKKTTSASKKK